MQDQGKRLLLAVALALAFMLVWNKFWGPKEDDKKPPAAGSGSAVVVGPVAPPSPVGHSLEPTAPKAGGPTMGEAPRGPEQKLSFKFPRFTATFSSYGGALVSYKLADPRYERDDTKGELMPGLANTGAFLVDFANSTYVLPPRAEWKGEKLSDTQAKFTISTDTMDVEKVFTILPENFLVKM